MFTKPNGINVYMPHICGRKWEKQFNSVEIACEQFLAISSLNIGLLCFTTFARKKEEFVWLYASTSAQMLIEMNFVTRTQLYGATAKSQKLYSLWNVNAYTIPYTIPYNFHDAETVWNPIVFPLSRRVCAHEVGYALLCILPHGKSLLSPPYETHCNEPLPFYGILLAHLIIPFTMEYECH